MNLVESYTTLPDMPVGNCFWISGTAARTRAATSSKFACGATLMAMNTDLLPLNATLVL